MPLTNSQMRDVNSVLHPYTNLVKLRETGATVFERGKGVRVYDDTGKDYIEAMAGLWSTALGWGENALAEAAEWLSERHDGLAIRPLVADFTKTRTLPLVARRPRKLGFFSGSTIGNLSHAEARAFLANAARLLGRGASFLVGVDLKKDPAILIPAYNDGSGVTAAFNLNLLARINRELDGDIDVGSFVHDAIYDEANGRIEMHLVSLARQTARVLGREFSFARGERIHTENSHKYSVEEFRALAASAGWTPDHVWTDTDRLFSLHLLRSD